MPCPHAPVPPCPHAQVTRRGVGGLEMLAMEMKASGSYLSRGLSYRHAEFELATISLTPEQRACFDAAASFWAERLLPDLEDAAKRTSTPAGRLTQQYWSAHQRFFKQLCVCVKVPALVERVRAALADGYAVVIGLQSTGEAALERAVASDGDLRAPISLCAAMLLGFVESHFPVTATADAKLDKELARAEAALLEARHALAVSRAALATARGLAMQEAQAAVAHATRMCGVAEMGATSLRAAVAADRATAGQVDPECLEMRSRLLAEASALALPPAALDSLIDELGGKKAVAEMTGRKGRMVRTADGRRFVYESRAKPESCEMENLNVGERNAFMSGGKYVAIISDAASTGISLQADRRVANRRRRCHITLELPWSADKAVQQLGRSHRANQVSAPLYILLNTDVGGEARFASAVARRLQALGALTKGDRRAEIGALEAFNFDTVWGKRALRLMLHGLYEGATTQPLLAAALSSPDLPLMLAGLETIGASEPTERDKLEVKRFLNRLLGLPLKEQSLLFELFTQLLDSVITSARKDGRYDEGIADLSGASVTVEEEEALLWRDPATGAETRSALVRVDRGVSWQKACEKLDAWARAEEKEAAVKEAAAEAVTAAKATRRARRDAARRSGALGEEDDDEDDDEGDEGEDEGSDMADFIVEDGEESGAESDEGVSVNPEEGEEGGAEGTRGADADHTASRGADGVTVNPTADGEASEGTGTPASDQSNAARGVTHGAAAEGTADDDAVARQRRVHAAKAAGASFYRSRFLQAGERLYVLALPRSNKVGQLLLTRPSTGPSPFEEDAHDLRRKYEAISPEEARAGWTATFDGAAHERVGGRLSHVQILTGCTLPLLPLLEGLVKKGAASLTKRDQSVSAVRVQLDGRRLVGVRFPRTLMQELRVELLAFHAQRSGSQLRVTNDPVAPIDAAALALGMRPPQTIKSFFAARPPKSSAPAVGVGPPAVPPPAHVPAPAPPARAATAAAAGRAPAGASPCAHAIDLTGDDDSTARDAAFALRMQQQYDAEVRGARPPPNPGTAAARPASGKAKPKPKPPAKLASSGSGGSGSSTAGGGTKRKSVLELLREKQVPRSE